ncbi:MAG: HAD family hydrolase, partial [Polyangiaceae bacterium]
PCALVLAAPSTAVAAIAVAARHGILIKGSGFLEHLADVSSVVFDKTGTLTTGALVLDDPGALDGLAPDAMAALHDLVARSGHPKSAAIREALERRGPPLDPRALVVEHPGLGVEMLRDSRRWRLGEPSWVSASACAGDCAFGVDGTLVAAVRTTERLRGDAVPELRALAKDGVEVWMLSGDDPERVRAAAVHAGIPAERALGGRSPRDKASFLAGVDRRDTLLVGDGVNDALALDRAYVSGTPAVDRPYIPARADFFFVTPGLAPVRLALRSARVLAQVVRVDLAIALAYNALAIGFALAGRMSPLLCAVLMPASSLTTIGATVAALSARSRPWRS